MIYVVAIIALVCVTGATAWVVSIVFRDSRVRDRAWEKKETAWAVERQQLLDRIMYLVDKPWEVPEIVHERAEPEEELSYDPMQAPISDEFSYYPQGVV